MLLLAQSSAWEKRVQTHQRSLEIALSSGTAFLGTSLSIHELYREAEALGAPDPDAVERYRQLIELTTQQGLTPIGTTSTWAFPEFVQAPRIRFQGPSPYLTPVYEPFCVPLTEDVLYRRLIDAEARIFQTLARSFPEVDHWMIGPESPPEFLSCSNPRLQPDELAVFVADVVEVISKAVKSENPSAVVILHFLARISHHSPWRGGGEWRGCKARDEGPRRRTRAVRRAGRGAATQQTCRYPMPQQESDEKCGLGTDRARLYAGEPEFTPQEFQSLLPSEISARSGSSAPYDLLASDLEPELMKDRRAAGAVPPLTEGTSGGESATASGSGWQIKYLDRFKDLTPNSDLISDYADWVEWRLAGAAAQTSDEVVSGTDLGKVQIRLPVAAGQTSVGGARSEPNSVEGANNYVPTSDDFSNDNSTEDDLWTAVSDFFGAGGTEGAHASVFVRVNDRIYSGQEDQTRFGSIAFSTPLSRNAALCSNGGGTALELLGALQLTGDDLDEPGERRTYLACFDDELTRDPWAGTSTSQPGEDLFRVQILESTTFNGLVGLKIEWKAEVRDLSVNPAELIGASNWISHFTLTEFFDIGVPELLDSRIAFGLGPSSEVAGIDVEQTGTSFWIF